MASDPDLVKISTEAAERFVENYYTAMSRQRSTLALFYVPKSSTDSTIPTIIMNGNNVADGAAVQDIFDNQMPPAKYEAQSVDCHVINPAYSVPGEPANTKKTKSHISLLVTVSGWVRYSDVRSDPQRGFSETFVLVPNPEADNQKGGKKVKDFLIQSQNFRFVV